MLTTNFRPKRKTVFYTFYSFKGGVGRTMSLINVACILAARGRRVLMIDFDLEAPGLTNLALRDIAPEADRQRDGLVELIQDFVDAPEDSPLADEVNRAPFFDKYVRQLQIPDTLEPLEGGSLHLLPCGHIDSTYTERLYAIDFKQLYSEGVGQPLFKYLKSYIRDSELYDYVLIDSRTGFSDEGGICTRDLADHIFIITGLNRQNIDGTVQFLRQLEASGWQEGQLVFVASPMPTGLEELRDQRIKAAKEAIEQTRFKADFKLRIPYHPRLALDEEPFIYRWSDTDLFPSYQLISRVLRELANDTPLVLSQEIAELMNQHKYDEALSTLQQLLVEEHEVGLSVLISLTAAIAASPDTLLDTAIPFFETLLQQKNDAEQHRLYGNYLRNINKFPEAIKQLNLAREMFASRHDISQSAYMLIDIGNINSRRGDSTLAMENYAGANELFVNVGDKVGSATAILLQGMTLAEFGNLQEGLPLTATAVTMLRSTENALALANALVHYGFILLLKGEYSSATALSDEALFISHELRSQLSIAQACELGAELLIDQKNYEAAMPLYSEALHIFTGLDYRIGIASIQLGIGYIKVQQGDDRGLERIQNSIQFYDDAKEYGRSSEARITFAEALFSMSVHRSNEYVTNQWEYIQQHGVCYARYRLYVVRAKIKAALGDEQGAAEDAQVAVNFYREQGVHTLLAQEAEELAKLNSAAQGTDAETSASRISVTSED